MINVRTIKKLTNNEGLTIKAGKVITYKSGWQVADYGVEVHTAEECIKAVRMMKGNCGVWYSDGVRKNCAAGSGVGKAEAVCRFLPQRAADLQRCTLAACAAAEEMGEDGGKENGGQQRKRRFALTLTGFDDGIGIEARCLELAIKEGDGKTCHGEGIDDACKFTAPMGHMIHRVVEGGADDPACSADDKGGKQQQEIFFCGDFFYFFQHGNHLTKQEYTYKTCGDNSATFVP